MFVFWRYSVSRVNKSIMTGIAPIRGRGMCFDAVCDWLQPMVIHGIKLKQIRVKRTRVANLRAVAILTEHLQHGCRFTHDIPTEGAVGWGARLSKVQICPRVRSGGHASTQHTKRSCRLDLIERTVMYKGWDIRAWTHRLLGQNTALSTS